jgi:hypothetical protein
MNIKHIFSESFSFIPPNDSKSNSESMECIPRMIGNVDLEKQGKKWAQGITPENKYPKRTIPKFVTP